MSNKCWDCKNNILKLKILVPHDRTIREYVHGTGDFQSDIVAVIKEKQEQFTVWFRSGSGIKVLTFKMLHICKLKIEEVDKECTCRDYIKNGEHNYISNIIYSKQPIPEIKRKEIAAAPSCTTC